MHVLARVIHIYTYLYISIGSRRGRDVILSLFVDNLCNSCTVRVLLPVSDKYALILLMVNVGNNFDFTLVRGLTNMM